MRRRDVVSRFPQVVAGPRGRRGPSGAVARGRPDQIGRVGRTERAWAALWGRFAWRPVAECGKRLRRAGPEDRAGSRGSGFGARGRERGAEGRGRLAGIRKRDPEAGCGARGEGAAAPRARVAKSPGPEWRRAPGQIAGPRGQMSRAVMWKPMKAASQATAMV